VPNRYRIAPNIRLLLLLVTARDYSCTPVYQHWLLIRFEMAIAVFVELPTTPMILFIIAVNQTCYVMYWFAVYSVYKKLTSYGIVEVMKHTSASLRHAFKHGKLYGITIASPKF
jgi:hypothetical protein